MLKKPMAVILTSKGCHDKELQPGGFKQSFYCLRSSLAPKSEIKVSEGHAFSEGSGEEYTACLSLSPWCCWQPLESLLCKSTTLPPSSQDTFPVFPSYHIFLPVCLSYWMRGPFFNNSVYGTLFSNNVHRYQGLGLQHIFSGYTTQSLAKMTEQSCAGCWQGGCKQRLKTKTMAGNIQRHPSMG